jgi:AcrR family transcriptional regulator
MSATLRADAERNRCSLIAAAEEVFADGGLAAPLDEIARRAGVGNATLYRRFPDRSSLICAVFAERMREYAELAEQALAQADAWEGFARFVSHLCELQATDRGLSELLTTTLFDGGESLSRLRSRALAAVRELIDRGHAQGTLRADLTSEDVVLMLMANSGLVRRTAGHAPDAWRRHLAFVLDGLRATDPSPAPPAPSEQAVAAAMRAVQL